MARYDDEPKPLTTTTRYSVPRSPSPKPPKPPMLFDPVCGKWVSTVAARLPPDDDDLARNQVALVPVSLLSARMRAPTQVSPAQRPNPSPSGQATTPSARPYNGSTRSPPPSSAARRRDSWQDPAVRPAREPATAPLGENSSRVPSERARTPPQPARVFDPEDRMHDRRPPGRGEEHDERSRASRTRPPSDYYRAEQSHRSAARGGVDSDTEPQNMRRPESRTRRASQFIAETDTRNKTKTRPVSMLSTPSGDYGAEKSARAKMREKYLETEQPDWSRPESSTRRASRRIAEVNPRANAEREPTSMPSTSSGYHGARQSQPDSARGGSYRNTEQRIGDRPESIRRASQRLAEEDPRDTNSFDACSSDRYHAVRERSPAERTPRVRSYENLAAEYGSGRTEIRPPRRASPAPTQAQAPSLRRQSIYDTAQSRPASIYLKRESPGATRGGLTEQMSPISQPAERTVASTATDRYTSIAAATEDPRRGPRISRRDSPVDDRSFDSSRREREIAGATRRGPAEQNLQARPPAQPTVASRASTDRSANVREVSEVTRRTSRVIPTQSEADNRSSGPSSRESPRPSDYTQSP